MFEFAPSSPVTEPRGFPQGNDFNWVALFFSRPIGRAARPRLVRLQPRTGGYANGLTITAAGSKTGPLQKPGGSLCHFPGALTHAGDTATGFVWLTVSRGGRTLRIHAENRRTLSRAAADEVCCFATDPTTETRYR